MMRSLMVTTPTLMRAASKRAADSSRVKMLAARANGAIVGAQDGFLVVRDGDEGEHRGEDVFAQQARRRAKPTQHERNE